jgi:hypothetical protein
MLRRIVAPLGAAAIVYVGSATGAAPSSPAPVLDPIETRGCCSHHHGVCGCNAPTHEVTCCDGSFSPSCGC